MKSVHTKGKSKRKNEKLRKVKLSTKNVNSIINPDLSSLRKPIDTSVSDLYQVSKLLEDGTDEVKSILSYECDIIYECRTCRSLFRSIVNLISHKREYCRDKFDITLHRNMLNNYNLHSAKELTIHMYKTGQTIIKDDVKNDRILRSQVSKETHKKDLSTVIDMLCKKRKGSMESNFLNKLETENAISDAPNDQHIYLESIDTNNSAMYQTVRPSDIITDNVDSMKEQITELQSMADQHPIILEGQTSENQSEKSDSPIQLDISDEEAEILIPKPSTNNLACTICNAKFSTKKTLTVHVKTLHTSQRMCYPCPCCTSTFANTWSVYRHLYKVHRKTNEQVRKLRSQIQEKAFHRETTAMKGSGNSRANKTSVAESVTTKDNIKIQESIKCVVPNAELQNCGKRRQKSGRKKGLPARVQTPVTVCDKIATKLKQSDKITLDSTSNNTLDSTSREIEDIDAETNTITKPPDKRNVLNINSERVSLLPDIYETRETSIQIQTISNLDKEDWEKLDNQQDCLSKCSLLHSTLNNDLDVITSRSFEENRDNFVSNKNSESSEIVCANTNEISSVVPKIKSKKRKASSYNDDKQLTDLKEKNNVIEMQEDNSKQQSMHSIRPNEMNSISVMESRIASIANLQKLQCLLCKRKFTSMPNLRRHMAIHIGWNRYRCKLCDFKCFVKCDCVAHCNKMHNAQNNRVIIAEMVIEIPQHEYTYNEDIIMEINTEKGKVINVEKRYESDIVDENVSSYQTEKHVNIDNSSDSNIILQDKVIASEQSAELNSNVEHRNVEHESVDTENGNKTTTVRDMEEYMMNCGSGKLDVHPDLKRMIMEVILGSEDTNVIEETNSEMPALEINNDAGEHVDTNDNENSIASIDKTRKPSCSMPVSLKHQRPIRNRIKPLNEDFVYDLKEVAFRKGCALFNDPGTLHVRKKTKLYD